jgi:hypothetical protein
VTQARKWTTSSGLRTTGKITGFFGAGITASNVHVFWSVTLLSSCANAPGPFQAVARERM